MLKSYYQVELAEKGMDDWDAGSSASGGGSGIAVSQQLHWVRRKLITVWNGQAGVHWHFCSLSICI
jgi:hypothetical protein